MRGVPLSFSSGTTVELLAAAGGEVACHRPPEDAGIDVAGPDIVDHALAGRVIAPVDHQGIRLGLLDQPKPRHDVAGRRASDHADALVPETRVGEAVDAVERAAGAIDQRIGRSVIVVGVEHELITLGVADHHVAALGEQGLPDEAGGLGKPCVLDRHLEFGSNHISDLVLETLAFLVRKRQVRRVGADAQRRAIDQIGAMRLCSRRRRNRHAREDRQQRRGAALFHPKQAFSSASAVAGFSIRFAGRPRGSAPSARAFRYM